MVFFHSTPIDMPEYRLFEVPVSYFVLLYGNENDLFYNAEYNQIKGYVKKDSVTPINEIPQTPFAITSYRIFTPSGVKLYDMPQKNSSYSIQIPQDSTISNYHGKIQGEALISSSTNTWFYSSFVQDGITFTGYVFSYYCDEFEPIETNTEPFTKIQGSLQFSQDSTDNNLPPSSISEATIALIIIGISLPLLVILYLILKNTSQKQKSKIPELKKPKKDYYEFNQDDI